MQARPQGGGPSVNMRPPCFGPRASPNQRDCCASLHLCPSCPGDITWGPSPFPATLDAYMTKSCDTASTHPWQWLSRKGRAHPSLWPLGQAATQPLRTAGTLANRDEPGDTCHQTAPCTPSRPECACVHRCQLKAILPIRTTGPDSAGAHKLLENGIKR